MEEYEEPPRKVIFLKPRQLSEEEMDRVCKRAYEDCQRAEAEARRITEDRQYILNGGI